MMSKIVIVAGAGASVDFGLSSGEKILRDFLKTDLQGAMRNLRTATRLTPEFCLENFCAFLNVASSHLLNNLGQFQQAIGSTAATSIDLFCDHRPEFGEIAKLWTVQQLYRAMPDAETACGLQWFTSGTTADVPNWIAGAVRRYLHGVRPVSNVDPARLTFITFNYDRFIELGLGAFLGSALSGDLAGKMPRVIHIHGSFQQLPRHHRIDDIIEQASRIRFVQETEEAADTLKEIEDARMAIQSADQIYCVGFAFNRPNCDLIGLPTYAKKVRALNYDGRSSVMMAMREIGVRPERILSGRPGKGQGISAGQAAADDFFFM